MYVNLIRENVFEVKVIFCVLLARNDELNVPISELRSKY